MWHSLWCLWGVASAQASTALSPDEAVQLALDAAPRVDASRAATDQARRDVTVAAVDFAPRLEGSATYTRLSEVELLPLSFGGVDIENPFQPILDNYAVKGTLTWPVSDLFFTFLPAYKAQLGAVAAREATERIEANKVARSTLEAYYQLAQVRAGLGVAEDGVALLEAHQRQIDDLFQAGQVTRADALSVQAQLAEARAQRESLVRSEAVAEAHLAALVQVPAPIEVALPDARVPTLGEGAEAELVERAMAQRPEVQALDALIRTHTHAARAQTGAALPHLALVGNATYANPNQRIIPPTAEFYGTWDATVALSWSPGESLKRANEASRSRTDRRVAEADREELERGLAVQVASALADLSAAARLIEVAEDQREAAEAAFEAQSDLLTAGSSTATEALQAEAAARRARHALVQARVDLALAEVGLHDALGDLIPASPENER